VNAPGACLACVPRESATREPHPLQP
jgi:hypothetical protein